MHVRGIALLQLEGTGTYSTALHRDAAAGQHWSAAVAAVLTAVSKLQCNLASLAMQVEDGDADGAIERLRATLRRTPGHPAVLYGLGNALMAAARYTQARESFAMATHGAPAHPGLRLNLATVELALGNVSKADVHAQRSPADGAIDLTAPMHC